MKLSESWLREWINPSLSQQELADTFIMAGINVETMTPVSGPFNQVVVALVITTQIHPGADKLTICQIDFGADHPIQVVCGAPNVRQGLKVALALPGAILPGEFCIKESKIRGEVSKGMLCSALELGLADDSEGILELPEDAPLGADFRTYYQLDDLVFDFDLTPNRADCLSVFGLARELAALTQAPLSSVLIKEPAKLSADQIDLHVDAQSACPLYCGRIIRGINASIKTPLKIKERLRRSGLRSHHIVVDLLNYVMLELGQPLHAFSCDRLNGAISVRHARPEESLTLMNQETVRLAEDVLVIADEQNVLAMAGIMSGAESQVREDSQSIYIESAYFEPLAIGPIARRYKITSDAALRFERGVDPNLAEHALSRVTELLLEWVGGEAGPMIVQSDLKKNKKLKRIYFNPARVLQLSGLTLEEADMKRKLESLGFVVGDEKSPWEVQIPSFRFDLSTDACLVEEIIRLFGYDKILPKASVLPLKLGSMGDLGRTADLASRFLSSRGYSEILSYGFVDAMLNQMLYPDAKPLDLLNPISAELSQMRLGLWPGLLASFLHNFHRQLSGMKIFEVGTIFDGSSHGSEERWVLSGLVSGDFGHLNWGEYSCRADFFDLKGEVEALFQYFHISNLRFTKANHPALHPGQSAEIWVDDCSVGFLGLLHPKCLDELDLAQDIVVFELALQSLSSKQNLTYQNISKYPQVRRDLSFVVDNHVSAAEIEETVFSAVKMDWIKSFDIFDLYQGDGIPLGKKSIAIALRLQNDHKTLVEEEIFSEINAIIKALADKFDIKLRD